MNLMELITENDASENEPISAITISNVVLEPYYNLLLNHNMRANNKNRNVESKVYQLEDLSLICNERVEILVVNLSLRVLLGDKFFSFLAGVEEPGGMDEVLNIIDDILYQVKNRVSFSYGQFFSFTSVYDEIYTLCGAEYSCQQRVNDLNRCVYQKYKEDFLFIASDALVAQVGILNTINKKDFYRWNGLYDKKYLDVMTKEIVHIYNIESGKRPKLLVVDCDNVLWGGSVADDGIDNIVLGLEGEGKKYRDFQLMLKLIHNKGVMLAIASKNDYDDIIYILENNPNMLLQKHDFIWIAANWEPKAANILNRVKEMNIALDSVWFIDDTLGEILEISKFLPEINTIVFDIDNYMHELNEINLKIEVDKNEIRNRFQTYVMDEKRHELKRSVADYEAYLSKLQTKISIQVCSETEIGRISELSFRTNKFTNGKRLSKQDIERYHKNGDVFVVYVEDVFGPLGLVASFILVENELLLFCLSCRAANRGVEKRVMEYIANNYMIHSYQFEPTGKNGQIKQMLDELICSGGIKKRYRKEE